MLYFSAEHEQVVYDQLGMLSTSLRYVRSDAHRTAAAPARKGSMVACGSYFERMAGQDWEPDSYEHKIAERRSSVFIAGIAGLLRINKGNHLSGFNLKYLSLPVEHSLQHNNFMYQTIKRYLEDQKRAKVMQEVGLVAHANNINLPNISQMTFSMMDFALKGQRAESINLEKVASSTVPSASGATGTESKGLNETRATLNAQVKSHAKTFK